MSIEATSESPASARNGAGPGRLPFPHLDPFDPEVFQREYREPCKAVLLKGAASSWPAVTAWTPESIAESFGDLEITPSVDLPDTEVPYTRKDADHRRTMTVRDFVARMDAGERCYIDQVVVDKFPGMTEDIDFAGFSPPDLKDTIFWMGASTRSGMHYDFVDNFFAQIHGTKLAILADPAEARNLHVFSDSHTKSQVAPEHPDLSAHPRFARATLYQETLEPGDVLYIPRGWWHYLASSERAISLACWHGTPLSPIDELGAVWRMRNPRIWARLVRDFIWLGLLRRPHQARLYAPPPTGYMLYDLVRSMLPGRRTTGGHPE